jgi:hypothetical protein
VGGAAARTQPRALHARLGAGAGADGSDTLSGVELLQFDDAVQLISNTADITDTVTFSLPGSDPIYGTDGGDFLTVATNVNAHPINLGDGLDNLFLNAAGNPVYVLDLHDVEQVFDLAGSSTVTMMSPLDSAWIGPTLVPAYIDLGAGT